MVNPRKNEGLMWKKGRKGKIKGFGVNGGGRGLWRFR